MSEMFQELKIDPDGKHYRCQGCHEICLILSEDHLICMSQTEFDRYGGDPETSVWRHIDPETLGTDRCPTCRTM